ncbi:MAG: flippase [Methylococcales bacterium]
MRSKFKQLKSKQGFVYYLKNTFWLLAEKVLRLTAGLFVGVLVARYLGSEQYGILAYALSLVAIFSSMIHLGLGGLVVRELVKKPEHIRETLGTVFILKCLASVVAIAGLILVAYLSEIVYSPQFWSLLIASAAILFQPFQVIDFWFEAQVQGRNSALVKTCALLITSLLKIALVFSGAHLLTFVVASTLEAVFLAIFFIWVYVSKAKLSLLSWRASKTKAKTLLSQSWLIMLGSFFAVIYLKIDQIMLKWLSGAHEVGVYAVAAQLSEVWYFVPVSIVASLYPKLIQLKEDNSNAYNKRMQQIYDLLCFLGFTLALATTFAAQPLINLLYGAQYQEAGAVLAIHIWAGVFIFMRALLSKWILIENELMFSLLTQGFGAVANVLLNFYLIPLYGVYGAAIATLISYAVASYVVLLFYQKTRPVFWMMTKSLFFPLRLLAINFKS